MRTAYENNILLMQKVTPSMPYRGGLDEWRRPAKEKLCALLGMDRFKKVEPDLKIEYETEIEGALEVRFTFQSEEGYRVPCHLLLPNGIENPPLIITLQGHSKGMHRSLGRSKYPGEPPVEGDRDFCIRAVKEGFAAIALEQRNFGECGGTAAGPQCVESSLTAILMGRTTIGERVWDVMRLIDVVEESFSDRVDVNCISCMGNSGGGTATAYIAALEDRIKLAMPSCAMCTYKDSIGAMQHCACNFVPHIAEFFDMGDLMALACPKFYIQVSGIEDKIFPVDQAEKVFLDGKCAYEEKGISDRCVLIKGKGGHRFYADDAWPYVHKFLQR